MFNFYFAKEKEIDRNNTRWGWQCLKYIPSRPTVAMYVPSAEKEILLIEPWHICHLAIGLLCNSHLKKKMMIRAYNTK
jgi:hypothetical protein